MSSCPKVGRRECHGHDGRPGHHQSMGLFALAEKPPALVADPLPRPLHVGNAVHRARATEVPQPHPLSGAPGSIKRNSMSGASSLDTSPAARPSTAHKPVVEAGIGICRPTYTIAEIKPSE